MPSKPIGRRPAARAPRLGKFLQRAQRQFVADGEDTVERAARGEQRARGQAALLLTRKAIVGFDQPRLQSPFGHAFGIAIVALLELALERPGRADAGDPAAAALDQVASGKPRAAVVVGANPFQIVIGRTPADLMRTGLGQIAEIAPGQLVLGGADHDRAIGLALFLVAAGEVLRPVLKADQRVIAARRGGGAIVPSSA